MSFDVLAAHYRWMELVLAGEKLQRCRTRFLDDIGVAQAILLAGEGHGRCLVECCRRFPNARVVYLDASSGMLREAEARLTRSRLAKPKVEFLQADLLNWSAGGRRFDLIITNFFLDCFPPEQLTQVIDRLGAAALSKANWLLADFQVPGKGWRRLRGQIILSTMYLFFRTVTGLPARRLSRPDASLHRAGFNLNRRVETEWELLHSDWWTRNPRGVADF